MIAKNFIRFPEALRFQREMFSSGYKNQPRIMRLMTVIFDQRPSAPDWWTIAKARARNLAKQVKKSIMALFEKPEVTHVKQENIKNAVTCKRWNPCLEAIEDDQDMMRIGAGRYRNFCRMKYGYQGSAKGVGHHLAYWGGFSE